MKKLSIFRVQLTLPVLFIVFFAFSCRNNGDDADAYGNFEADEVIVSAEAQGRLVSFFITEGSQVEKGQIAGRIDSTVPTIKREQLMSQYSVTGARLKNLDAQLKVQDEQRVNLVREVDRITKLLKDNAATQQQYDDITGKLKVLDSQTEALKSQRNIIQGEGAVVRAQLDEVGNSLDKCRITCPLKGTVLEKYVEAGELVTPGKALFKVANIGEMELKVYISGSQLSSVAIGDTVTVNIDSRDGGVQKLPGVVSWISSQVEFTPKIIQTRDERVNMVYGVKIRVKNDGRLKIGMPGEVRFTKIIK